MRLLRRPELRILLVAAIGAAAWLTVRHSHAPQPTPLSAAPVSWGGVVSPGGRPAVDLTGRYVVVLKTPSVAERVAKVKLATESAERRWTAEVFAAQQQVLTQLARHGLGVRPDYTYARTLDGFSATLDPRAVTLLEHNPDVAGVYPVRVAYPASLTAVARAAATAPVTVPGLDGTGITIALLDTGVDLKHPYLRTRVEPGIDVVGGTGDASAQADPQQRRLVEKHGTELAGVLVGFGGPRGAQGVAPGATVLPIRIAGWQAAAAGRDVVYARSDQLIAGLERAVDPNDDGDTHDAARIALVGVAEPFASFADSPEAQAVAGALTLDTLVVAPAGNDGAGGPLFGTVAGPAGAPGALAVAATDPRASTAAVRVVLRQGLDVLSDGTLPLLGAAAPARTLELALAVPAQAGDLTGKVAVVPAGTNPLAQVNAAVANGASAVIVYGRRLPAGTLTGVGVPVIGAPASFVGTVLPAVRQRYTVVATIGRSSTEPNDGSGRIASFSSRGLTFSGLLAPQLAAPGVAVETSDAGTAGDGEPAYTGVTGTSVAAAAVAGAAALVAQARPGMTARDLASLLTGFARPLAAAPASAAGGEVDPGAGIAGEVTASVTTLGFGPWHGKRWRQAQRVELTNVSSRPLQLTLGSSSRLVSVDPATLDLGAGASAPVTVTARAASRPAVALVNGSVTVRPAGGETLRLPWTVVFRPFAGSLLQSARISPQAFAPSDTKPATLSVVAGRVGSGSALAIQPLARLDVLLYTAGGRFLGTLARERDLLPGVYRFGITGRRASGAVLAAGSYEIRLVAVPTFGGTPSRAKIPFRLQSG